MATMDDLAANISKTMTQAQRDMSNQDQLLFGTGDVQITKQDGTKTTVKAWSSMSTLGIADTVLNNNIAIRSKRSATGTNISLIKADASNRTIVGDNAVATLVSGVTVQTVNNLIVGGTGTGKTLTVNGPTISTGLLTAKASIDVTGTSVFRSNLTLMGDTEMNHNVSANPTNGTVVNGGKLISSYSVANADKAVAYLQARNVWGSSVSSCILNVANAATGGHFDYNFGNDGIFRLSGGSGKVQIDTSVPGPFSYHYARSPIQIQAANAPQVNTNYISGISIQGATTQYGWKGCSSFGNYYTGSGNWPSPAIVAATTDPDGAGIYSSNVSWIFQTSPVNGVGIGSIITSNGVIVAPSASDRRIKKNIKDVDGKKSLDNIKAMQFKEYNYNWDEEGSPARRGIIAQDIEEIDPRYVIKYKGQTQDGIELEDIHQPEQFPLLMDALAAIKVLSEKIEALENELRNRK